MADDMCVSYLFIPMREIHVAMLYNLVAETVNCFATRKHVDGDYGGFLVISAA